MALHLNLHHEIAKQQIERRRDPLKLGMYGLVVLVVCLVGLYVVRMGQVRLARAELKQTLTEWDVLKAQEVVAAERERQLNEIRTIAENLRSSMNSRFFWAPLLQELGNVVPRNVQLNRLTAVVTLEHRLTINLEGVAAGQEPRKEAEGLRVALEKKLEERYAMADATFRSLEDGSEIVTLDGQELGVALFSFRVDVDASGAPLAGMPEQHLTLAADTRL
jgi:hypothetical protein